MKKLLAAAVFFALTVSYAYAHNCPAICTDSNSCYRAAEWVADGEIYNVETYWSKRAQAYVTRFDFAIDSWVKGEMRYGHFLHFKTNYGCNDVMSIPEYTGGIFRLYGTSNQNEYLYLEKISD